MNYVYEAYLDRWDCSNKITSNAYRNVLDLLCHANFTTEKEKEKKDMPAMCISKKALGNKGNFNEVFKKHIPGYIKKD